MEHFSVFISKIKPDSGNAEDFKSSLIEVLCIDDNEADEILKNIPGVLEDNLSKGAAEALADILSSIGGVVEIKNSLEKIKEVIKEVSNASSDFDMLELSLEDPEILKETPQNETLEKNTLAHLLEDGEDSLLDMTLMLEQSRENETPNPFVSSSNNKVKSEPKAEKEFSPEHEGSVNAFDANSLGLMLEDEEVSPIPKIPEVKTPKAPEVKTAKAPVETIQKLPLTPSPEIENRTHEEETPNVKEDDQVIIKEVLVPAQKQSSPYTLPAIGALVIILAMYMLMPDTTPKQNEIINPEVMKQLLKAQKVTVKQKVIEDVVVEKRMFESKISNRAWEIKSRVESLKGGIQSLELQFSNKDISLPTPEEYIAKEFIPQIVTIGLSYRATASENAPHREVSVPARIYTKIGDTRKRFTIPLLVSLNEEGRLVSILSSKEENDMPPGTFVVENYDKEKDTITPKIYFMVPLKEVAAVETNTDPPKEK